MCTKLSIFLSCPEFDCPSPYFHRFLLVNEKVDAHASIKKWPSEVVGILLTTLWYLRARTGDVPWDRGRAHSISWKTTLILETTYYDTKDLNILNIKNIAKMDTKTQKENYES